MTGRIPYDLIHGKTELREVGGAKPPRTIDFLPHVFPPDNFVPFDVVDSQSVPAVSTVTIPIFGPVNANAVVRWFANECTLAAGYLVLTWTILVSGVPSQPYINMLRSRGTVDNPDPIILRVAPNRVVTVTVTNADPALAYVANTRLKGWIY